MSEITYEIEIAGSRHNPYYVINTTDENDKVAPIDMLFDTHGDAYEYAQEQGWTSKFKMGLNR